MGEDCVECFGCGQRFVGGDLTSRLSRWRAHANDGRCEVDLTASTSKAHQAQRKAGT